MDFHLNSLCNTAALSVPLFPLYGIKEKWDSSSDIYPEVIIFLEEMPSLEASLLPSTI